MPVATDLLADLDRQTDRLVETGFPALLGCTDEELRARVRPLADRLPARPFVLVVPGAPAHEVIACARLGRKQGFTTMEADDLARFVPTADVVVPDAVAYLIEDVDTGAATLGVRPDDALPAILAAGRTPLTLEEGLAVAVQHPEWLRERNCFELLGSRAGDKRVTGVWVSKGAPRLGWCWGGNPHTWLGMATAARRIA